MGRARVIRLLERSAIVLVSLALSIGVIALLSGGLLAGRDQLAAAVMLDEAELSDDQLLQALAVGDVVIMYGTRSPPSGLRNLALQIAAPFTPTLAAVGQAVILARRPGTVGLIGVAWTHLIDVSAPQDPLLREFIQAYLGRGAPGH
jgi:hypothetical protein